MDWLVLFGMAVFAVLGIMCSARSLVRAAVKARDEEWEEYIEARYGTSEKEQR